jgi:hypothetical protein
VPNVIFKSVMFFTRINFEICLLFYIKVIQELPNKLYQIYWAAAGNLFDFDVAFILVSVVIVSL